MRIGVVIEHFNPRRGGAEQWTWQFVQRLLARGHQVHVLSQEFSPEAGQLGIVSHTLARSRNRLRLARAAERAIGRLDLDVVHDMGLGWHCDVFHSHDGSRYAQWEQKLQVLPAWARPWKRAMIALLPRYREFRRLVALQLADGPRIVLALSRMVARDFERYHAVAPRRIRLVYNGVDVERFSPGLRPRYRDAVRRELGIEPREVVFLFVGHDFQRKGLATALRATARLLARGEPVRLLVVGGRRTGRPARRACGSEAGGAAQFVGSIDDPAPYYAAADAYVLPTFYDPCSLGVLEAAASGLPSITTCWNGAAELLADGVHGFVLDDPADDHRMADRMAALLDARLRQRMAAAARQLALEHTLDHNCDQIEAIYREVLAARAQPRSPCSAGREHLYCGEVH